MEQTVLLRMTDITKTFPGVRALDHVSLEVKSGTVHALMGENGAGKSTLMKCLFGIYSKDSGHIYLEESQRRFMQNMNDTIKEIPNPVRAMDQNMDLARLFLKGFDFSPIPVYSASVFTRQNVILSVPNDIHVFTRSNLMHWLEPETCFRNDNGVPVRMLANYFTESIKNAKK